MKKARCYKTRKDKTRRRKMCPDVLQMKIVEDLEYITRWKRRWMKHLVEDKTTCVELAQFCGSEKEDMS